MPGILGPGILFTIDEICGNKPLASSGNVPSVPLEGARITSAVEGRSPLLRADGLLNVDGLPIYKMADFELALVPVADLTES